jgi:hypothetical protein
MFVIIISVKDILYMFFSYFYDYTVFTSNELV